MSGVSPLLGVNVVSLAINLPGPLAAARLRSMGATVTKVEPPGGDPLRTVSEAWYDELTSGQRVVTSDLKSAAGRAALAQELNGADLLITSMRAAALAKLGLGRESLAATYPQLSHVEIVGHTGTAAGRAGHDLTYQAEQGTLQPLALPTVPVVDLLGSERAVSAALVGLMATARDGRGHHELIVLEDAAKAAGAAVRHGVTGVGAPLGGAHPGYRIYPSADGYVALAALEPHFWERTREALGVTGTSEEFTRVFAGKTSSEWESLAASRDIPLAAVREGAHAPGSAK
ncbi:CoA transferase [Leucobacter albus]|uniref:CoA transferase n=1 Tax=Leucobacter albus TaxID=272210 RepID=A0ABW3TSB4_9MICO